MSLTATRTAGTPKCKGQGTILDAIYANKPTSKELKIIHF